MTTATAPRTYAALAKDRWDTLTIGVEPGAAEPSNSDLIDAWMTTTREILGRMIHGTEDPAEYTLLCQAEDGLLARFGDVATELTEAVEAMRARGRIPA